MKKFYITTSIMYTNASPHLGFALELIQADVLARYNRLLNKDVFFLTGTDEHGAKVAKSAKEANKKEQKFVDEIVKKLKELIKILNISNNYFIRTTDKKIHWPTVQEIWLRMKKNNDLYKKDYEGFYCIGHEAFMKKSELKNGICPIHNIKPEIIKEENYFFRLTKYKNRIKNLIKINQIKIVPESRKNEVLKLIEESEDISFSRPRKDLKWGIPVFDDKDHTIYVWADALTNYLSGIGFSSDQKKFKRYWPADIHLIGKDILRFHAIYWPAMLLSARIKLPKAIYVHGFITVDGQKMSKTIGNVIDPFDLIKKYGSEAVRYYFLREIPSTEDGDFSYQKFENRYNADLVNNLGNLISRIANLFEKSSFKKIEKNRNKQIEKEIKKTWKNYHRFISKFEFHECLREVFELISFMNKFIDNTRPWQYLKEKNNQKLYNILSENLYAILNITWMLNPFLPKTSEKILDIFSIKKDDKKSWDKQIIKIKEGKILFPRLK